MRSPAPAEPVNQASQTITGTVDVADAGASVTILDGTTAIGTAIVQGNGSWSTTVSLTNGANSLTARVNDAAGNTATSSAVVYTLSTTGPTVTETLISDTGTSATDHVTANPALSGTGLANTVVHFTVDGTPVAGTATTDAQGAWSFLPSGLADGSHTIVASQTDSFGNTGSASLSFTLDTAAPSGGTPDLTAGSDTGTSNTDNLTSATAPTFTVALTPTAAVGDTVQLLLGGSPLAHPVTHVITATDVTAGSVSLTVTAGDLGADGTKQIAAQFSDAAGNSSTTSALSFTLDTAAPTVAITSTGGPVNQASQTITGTVDVADAGASVTILDGTTAIGTAIVPGQRQLEHHGQPHQRSQLADRTGERCGRQHRHQQRGGLYAQHHRADGDRDPDLRHRHLGHRPRHREPGAERHRPCQHGGAFYGRRHAGGRDGHNRCARRLVVYAERAGRRIAHHRGKPDRQLRQHRFGLAELHPGHGGAERRHAGPDGGLGHRHLEHGQSHVGDGADPSRWR
ncbi:hypothetical protein ACVWXO_011116 [Bradyrhizobium sp. LM2.7]